MEVDEIPSTSEMETTRIVSLKRKAIDQLQSLIASDPHIAPKRHKLNSAALKTYRELIKSYTPLLWSGKDISPRELAVRGWKCLREDSVQCVHCNKIISTRMPSAITTEPTVYKKALAEIQRQITVAHSLTCIHRSTVIDFHDTFLSLAEIQEAIIEVLKTYKFEPKIDEDLSVQNDTPPQAKFAAYSFDALLCACLNWRQTVRNICGGSQCVMQCDLCNRTVSLSSNCHFNPLSSHHRWCPVLDKDSRGNELWKARAREVLEMNSDSLGPLHDKLNRIRRALNASISAVVDRSSVL